jgi:5'-nucleotidase
MPVDLTELLVVGISSRALFDLAEANRVFELEGLSAYRAFQRAHERDILAPGTAFPLVKGLLAVNERAGLPLVEVVVLSRNDADSAMRVFRSIEAHGLAISRGIFRGGRDPWPFLSALSCDVFLTAEPTQVLRARELGVPAALIMPPPTGEREADLGEVRVAFDGDAVLFDDVSQRIFDRDGLDAFHAYEEAHAEEPMSPGPFRHFLEGLARVQDHFGAVSPIRTALVTARAAPAHYRVVNTLRAWGVRVDETYFLGGADKTEVLRAFGAHIFFDDQLVHAERAASSVPSAQVLWQADDLEDPDGSPATSVVVPKRRRGANRVDVAPRRSEDDLRPTDESVNGRPTPASASRRPGSPRAAAR